MHESTQPSVAATHLHDLFHLFDPLARRLCKAVYDIVQTHPDDWVALSRVADEIHVMNKELVDGAVAQAVQRGWLQANGKPVHSLLLTPAGRAVAARKK